MKQLTNNKLLIYSDNNYNHAVNYQSLYNFPVTLNFGPKHGRKKYVLSCGNSDNIEIWQDGIFLYILSQNNSLDYISLEVIDTEKQIVCYESVFIDSNEINNENSICFGILEKDSQQQLNVLFEYLN